MSTTEQMTPAEHAAAVALVNAVETGVSRTGAVFVTASAVTVAALALGLTPVASVVTLIAAVALAAALLLVVTRIYLGPVPQAPPEGPEAAPAVAQVAQSPATGSAPATAENRVIPTK